MLKLNKSAGKTPLNRKARRAAMRRGGKKSGGGMPHLSSAVLPPLVPILQKARVFRKENKFAEAEECYRLGLAIDPSCAVVHFGLGVAATGADRLGVAYEAFKQAVTLEPENALYWTGLGQCLTSMGQYPASAIAYENALSRKQDDAALFVSAAWAYFRDNQSGRALEAFEKALAIDPRLLAALVGKGQQHYSLGDVEAARKCFDAALEIDPACPQAFYRMVEICEDPDTLQQLTGRAERAIAGGGRSDDDIARLHFAVAKGYRRMKRYDDAFANFAAGNTVIRKSNVFDRDAFLSMVDDTIGAFTADIFDGLAEAACDTRVPVFIVGVPRSGSTLVEQIISSHLDVADAGEFPKLLSIVRLLGSGNGKLRYPHDIARFESEPLAALGADYLDALRHGQPGEALRITDKLLENFLNVGLIHILFPQAAIIHCCRDPMASCVSSFSQMFSAAKELAHTTDLADLGFYYRQYERLMAHWRAVLPEGRMFEIDYEDMVADQEAVSRRLVEYVGLPWDDACLEFYKAERSVRTASVAQVRNPVYTSSVEGWRKYERHLGPLKEALAAHG